MYGGDLRKEIPQREDSLKRLLALGILRASMVLRCPGMAGVMLIRPTMSHCVKICGSHVQALNRHAVHMPFLLEDADLEDVGVYQSAALRRVGNGTGVFVRRYRRSHRHTQVGLRRVLPTLDHQRGERPIHAPTRAAVMMC